MKPSFMVLVTLAVASACTRAPGRARSGDTTMAIDVRTYLPASPGDRWRVHNEPTDTFDHYGISAIDALGHAVMHGTDHATIDLYDVRATAAFLVSPEGRALVPVIALPIRRGSETAYTVPQGSGVGRCTLSVTATEESRTIAGSRFAHCFSQQRVCAMPAGGGLPIATTITEDETYCPTVGRVFRRFRSEPPLPFPGVPSDRRSTVVSFHVRGAPVLPPTTPIADRLIVVPSDLAAVCGGAVASTVLYRSATAGTRPPMSGLVIASDASEADVLLGFAMTDGPFVIEARPSAGELAAYVGADTRPSNGLVIRNAPPLRVGFSEASVFVRVTPNPSCTERASRIEPLLRSLLH